MKMYKFTLLSTTNIDELLNVEMPDIGSGFYSIISDMLHAKEYGDYAVEVDTYWVNSENPNTRCDLMFFVGLDRAAICDNGMTHWTDASSLDDAWRRYISDELSADRALSLNQ